MEISSFSADKNWKGPIFKVLAHNDTGAARGHQAGFLIPKALRKYMPPLAGNVDALNPTIDKRILADLFLDGKRLASTVWTH
jgi:putative restriction endonuclease